MNGVLIVTDRHDLAAFARLKPGGNVTVLSIDRAPSSVEALAVAGASIFPVHEVADRALAAVRDFYPRFADENTRVPFAAGRSLREVLRIDGGSAWWFTDTAEKSPLRSPFINDLYRLAVLDEVLARGWRRVRIAVSDRLLATCLERGLRSRGIHVERVGVIRPASSLRRRLTGWLTRTFWSRFTVLRLLWALQALGNRLALWLFGIRLRRDEEVPRAIIFSRYPALYVEPFSSRPRERNLVALLEPLRARGVVWQAVTLTLWPWQLVRHGQAIQRALAAERIVPLLLLSTPWDVLSGCLALLVGIACYRRHRARLEAHFGDWDVTSLWHREIDASLSGLELPNNVLLRRSIRRLALDYRPAVLIHPAEFQPMERAIWAGLAATGTRTVGFQHSTVSSNALSYFFAKGEIERALAGDDALATPLPDYYLTTGEWPLEVMRAAGFPASRSTVIGALRYNTLLLDRMPDREEARRRLGLPVAGAIVLVTTPSTRSDAIALVDAMAMVQPRLPRSLVLFKSHYHCRVEEHVRRRFAPFSPEGWEIVDVDADVHWYIRASDVVVLVDSTTGLEAVALRTPAVVFEGRTTMNLGPLNDVKHAALFAYSPAELRDAVRAALEPATVARLAGAWPTTVARNFYRLDGRAPERFLSALERMEVIPGTQVCAASSAS